MRHQIVAIVTVANIAIGGAAFASPLGAAAGVSAANNAIDPVQKVQYFWNGYDYCWYDEGWQGPGWYVCDYGPWVYGYWWGGPLGWHHWGGHGPEFHGGQVFRGGPAFRGEGGPALHGQAFRGGPAFHGAPVFRGGPAFHGQGGPAFHGQASRGSSGGPRGGRGGEGHH